MTIEINGSGTITGLTAGGLPDGSIATDDIANNAVTAGKLATTLDLSGKTVTLANGSVTAGQLATTLDLTGKTVTLPSGTGGKILQVQYALKTDPQKIVSTTADTDVTDLNATITPASNSSKIIVLTNLMVSQASNGYWTVHIYRGATQLFQGDAYGSNSRGIFGTQGDSAYGAHSVAGCYVDDSHSSGGSPITYQIKINPGSTATTYAVHVNRFGAETDANIYSTRGSSSIVLMEVA